MNIIISENQYKKLLGGITSTQKKYYISESPIHGKGTFASRDIKKGEKIGLLHLLKEDYYFTELGTFHNHSTAPNCVNYSNNDKRYLAALRDIKEGTELTTDYTTQLDLEQPGEDFIMNTTNG